VITLPVIALVALSMVSACADTEQPGAQTVPRQEPGWVWVGQGQPTNFGEDFAFCRRLLNEGRSIRPDITLSPISRGAESSYSDKRQYWDCMAARGWKQRG
jgi:hypothetical protein